MKFLTAFAFACVGTFALLHSVVNGNPLPVPVPVADPVAEPKPKPEPAPEPSPVPSVKDSNVADFEALSAKADPVPVAAAAPAAAPFADNLFEPADTLTA